MHCKIADINDIEGIFTLHSKYQIDTILEEDKKDGFVTTAFNKEQLGEIIEHEQGIFVAIEEGEVIAYVMSASWQYWSAWPIFAHMIENLPNLSYLGQTLSIHNSYQYGPVCVDKRVRGSGVLEKLFDFALESMQKRYAILVTFINKINSRSYAAHTRMGLEVICEFSFNANTYYELAYDTSKSVHKR
ncbi:MULTISPECIES: GNAT family N-acetyltransferase [unclassified Sulfurospirillum]|uniref:GNAT family acetyltransferase n=1 Tax=Sulfurospirillum cavolei TaxID=366522 RepID=A0A2D3W4D0_9BACT|nr:MULTISPECIES: GNAT family N-acetyltransferase [unclassified Sulfurospirillum]KHG34159.1 MAG: GNAT family acetyltransferase [Sulfurospirillum sp. MES]MCP3652900.1 GNAT family acetyltransferase [Sulfurospirillum sp. DNRA8]MCR1811752.1 GNAT family acetyltransferase [Sulfurospirillum sp. DNRA8]DAB36221.1 MAG TPA: GNAT family acetyltransferase [Sulfurospirillum cavolei]